MTGRNDVDRGRVIIAGGSVAGLFAGTLLRREGFAVDVFERSGEALASRGAGIASHPELFETLEQVGATPAKSLGDDSLGVEVVGRIVLDRDGTIIGEHPLPQIMLSWDRLYRVLRAVLPDDHYHAGRAVERFEQDDDGVTVHLADGARERAEWLIGADGIRSSVRRQLLPDLEPAYAGYVAWRGLIEESAMSAEARAVLGEHLMFCLPAGEQMLGYPVPGADEAILPGRRRYNMVWYRPADEATALTGQDGRRYDLSIPPGQVAEGAVAASPQLVFDRAILVGDAAFVTRPHTGMGVTKAALDALTLAQALAEPDRAAALAAWQSRRLHYGRAVVERARRLAAYLGDPAGSREETPAMFKERAASLMAETAISGWLRA